MDVYERWRKPSFFLDDMLAGKKILLAVTGSIAAYKSAYLVRLLVSGGAEVKVVLSPGALDFVTPLTFSTLSGHPVHSDFTEDKNAGVWTRHVDLALWADLMIVAPASANTLSKMVTGQCDNFLMAVYMSTRCKVMIAPAMDHDMFLHEATQQNLARLNDFGHQIIQPGEGALASGLTGIGRMAEPSEIFNAAIDFFHPNLPLKGKRALVTAGPTYEPIDPVRFVGNFSSGKMGFALAEMLAARGAEVTLVSGPSHQKIAHPLVTRTDVVTASEMHAACLAHFKNSDIAVMAAAVADYTPAHVAEQKIKKSDAQWTLAFEKTPDIAASLGKEKRPDQILVGFALETENEGENAHAKLIKKNFDFIVLNSLRDEGAGFGTDTNKISLIWPDNIRQDFGLKPKAKVAADIVSEIERLIHS
jgi:phosphopantothenoylcysteine decarboxylase/phosphopantothenate--cysteine ligase